jgi:hypothetical protein
VRTLGFVIAGVLALRGSTAVMFMGRKLVELGTYSGEKG